MVSYIVPQMVPVGIGSPVYGNVGSSVYGGIGSPVIVGSGIPGLVHSGPGIGMQPILRPIAYGSGLLHSSPEIPGYGHGPVGYGAIGSGVIGGPIGYGPVAYGPIGPMIPVQAVHPGQVVASIPPLQPAWSIPNTPTTI